MSRRLLDERARLGRDLVGVDLVADHQQQVRPASRGSSRIAAASVSQRVELAAALVLVLAQRVGRLVRGRHPAGAEHDLAAARPSGRCGWRSAGTRSARPDALAVEATSYSCHVPGSSPSSGPARSGGPPTRKVRSRVPSTSTSHGPSVSTQIDRLGLAHVTQQGAEDQVGHRWEHMVVEQELQRVGRSIHAAFPTRPRHPLRALDVKAMEMASGTRSCARRCFGSSTSRRRARAWRTWPAT